MPLAYIHWITGTGGGEHPDNTLPVPQPPLGIWGPGDPRPTNPIVIPPDAIAPGVPTHPIFLPVYPSHPIVIPPDGLAPGVPTHPIYLPVYPSHPIVIPPDAVAPGVPTHPIVLPIYPDQGLPPFPSHPIAPGGPPLGMWGPNDPRPTPPIVIPPEAIVPGADGKAHLVVYYQGQRVTFTVEVPERVPPTEATPKPA
jgi:hypothetical protein